MSAKIVRVNYTGDGKPMYICACGQHAAQARMWNCGEEFPIEETNVPCDMCEKEPWDDVPTAKIQGVLA